MPNLKFKSGNDILHIVYMNIPDMGMGFIFSENRYELLHSVYKITRPM